MTAIVDGPALLVTPRQAYLLSRAADLGRLRLQVRGQVAELDEVLFGLAALAARWEPHLVADAVHGPGLVRGSGRGDTVPAMLEPGEVVMRRSAVEKHGVDNLLSMNAGRPMDSGAVDAINGLRGDISGLTAFLMRQASVGGGAELLAPILMEIAHLLRSGGAGRSPGDTRAMALEFA